MLTCSSPAPTAPGTTCTNSRDAPGGTLVTDRVDYALPFGFLGVLAHRLFVRRALKRIFDYRQQRLAEIFPSG